MAPTKAPTAAATSAPKTSSPTSAPKSSSPTAASTSSAQWLTEQKTKTATDMTAAGVAACPLFYAAIVDTYDINAQSTHADRIKAKATTFCSEYSKTACTSVQSKDEEGNLVMSSTGAYGRYLAAWCVETVETSMVLSGATVVSAEDMQKALAKQLGVDSSAVEVVLSSLVSETSLARPEQNLRPALCGAHS